MSPTPAHALSHDWLLTLSGRWQFAAGLRAGARRADVVSAIEMLLVPVRGWNRMPDALLLRGWVLELALGLRVAARHLSPPVRMPVLAFAEELCATPRITGPLRRQARILLRELQAAPAPGESTLAQRARTYLDERSPAPTDLETLVEALETNPGVLTRAFRSTFGRTIVQYQRERRIEAAIGMLAGAVPVKQVAYDLGCGQATLRRLVRRRTGHPPRDVTRGRAFCEAPR